jgi:hypothetical protein
VEGSEWVGRTSSAACLHLASATSEVDPWSSGTGVVVMLNKKVTC